MNRNLTKSIAIACGLALTLSMIAATSFARGSGHSSRGHVSRSFSSRNASFNRGNFRFNHRFNNFRRYYGWGYYSPYSYNYGWGWGCYGCGNSYNSYGYNSYGYNTDGNNSYGTNYSGNPEMGPNPAGAPSGPVTPDQNAAPGQPGSQPAPGDMGPPAGQPAPLAAGQPADQPTPAIAAATAGPADKTPANNEEAVAEEAAPTTAATPNVDNKATDAVKPVDAAKPADAKPVVPPAPADPLVGTFKANPAPGVQIELTMRADTTFTWKFTAEGKTQTFSGLYEIGPNSLALTRDAGDKMDGTLERVGTGFKFRMKGAVAEDPGLTFTR